MGLQPGRQLAPAVPSTRAGDGRVQADELTIKVRNRLRHIRHHFSLERRLADQATMRAFRCRA